MKLYKLGKVFALGFVSVILLTACGSSEKISTAANNNENEDKTEEVMKIKIAFSQDGKPISYVDENGEAAGYEVDAMKLVDEKLEQYEFEFVPSTSDDIFIGVEQGKYAVGIKNAFFTEERTAKYLYPKEFLGLSSTGLVLKAENANIKSLSDLASAGLSLAPIASSSAQYTLVAKFNEQNPDNQIELKAGDEFSLDVVQWVNEGRSDSAIALEAIYNKQVLDEEGPYHQFKDDLVYNEFAVIETWPLFNKNQQEFADAYDKAMSEIKKTDALSKLMEKYYDKDLFALLDSAN